MNKRILALAFILIFSFSISGLAVLPTATGGIEQQYFKDESANNLLWINSVGCYNGLDTYAGKGIYVPEGIYTLRIVLNQGTPTNGLKHYNLIKNKSDFSSKINNSKLEFFINPIRVRNTMEVGVVCGTTAPFAALRIDLKAYLGLTDLDYILTPTALNQWKKVSIPLKYIKENGVFYNNGSTYNTFDWANFSGFTIAASDEGITSGNVEYARLDDVKLTSFIGEPSNLIATGVTNKSVSLSFNAPSVGTPTGYNIYRNDELIGTTTTTTYTDQTAQADTEYTYSVQSKTATATSDCISVVAKTEGYFSVIPTKGLYFSNIIFSNGGAPLVPLKITGGEIKIDTTLKNIDQAGDITFVTALYKGDQLITLKENTQTAISSNTEYTFSDTIAVPVGDEYTMDLFVLNSLSDMKLLSKVCKLNELGFNVEENSTVESAISEFNAQYSAQTFCVLVNGKTSVAESSKVLVIVTKDNSDITLDDIAYIGYIPTNNQVFSKSTIKIDEGKFDEGYYRVYVSSPTTQFSGYKTIYFAKESTITGLYGDLNKSDLSYSQIDAIITNPILGIDLVDYNLSNINKSRVQQYFVDYKKEFTNVLDIQQVLDKAIGLELLTNETSATNMKNWIAKYGSKVGLDSEFLNEYEKEVSLLLQDKITALMAENKIIYEKDVDPIKDINNKFKTAIIIGILTDNVISWKELETKIAKYCPLDTSLITNSSLDPADVYKDMIGASYIQLSDVSKKFVDVINALIKKRQDSSATVSSNTSSYVGRITKNDMPIVPLPQPPESKGFLDLESVEWAVDSINFLADNNIIAKGDNFRPNDNITREEFVKLVVLSFGLLDENARYKFDDVDATKWYYSYIASAKKANIINGITDNLFGIGENISRQDLATIIFRILNEKADLDASKQESIFVDEQDISDYALNGVNTMSKVGIISGLGENKFVPKEFATRAQTAQMIKKAIDYLKGVSK